MRRPLPARRLGGAALACVVLVVAGCSGDRDTTEGRKISAAVKRFALARGPDACAQMTPKALMAVYGHGQSPLDVSKANCLAASKRFSGAPVAITFVKITDSTSAHATAKTPDGRRYYSVSLKKRHGRWLINSVIPTQRPG